MAAAEIKTDHCSFYRILISSTGYPSICPAVVMQAALDHADGDYRGAVFSVIFNLCRSLPITVSTLKQTFKWKNAFSKSYFFIVVSCEIFNKIFNF